MAAWGVIAFLVVLLIGIVFVSLGQGRLDFMFVGLLVLVALVIIALRVLAGSLGGGGDVA